MMKAGFRKKRKSVFYMETKMASIFYSEAIIFAPSCVMIRLTTYKDVWE